MSIHNAQHQPETHLQKEAITNPHQGEEPIVPRRQLLNRRLFLGSIVGAGALSALGLTILIGKEQLYAASPILKDTIVFSNIQSETAQQFQQVNTSIITNTLGLKARQVNPPSGSLTFTLTCDPVKQNYLTVKLWGSDTDPKGGQLALTSINNTTLSPEYEYGQDHPEIDRLMGSAAFPGRFFYVTELLPLAQTTGKSQITLTIESFGQATPYNPTQKTASQTNPSRSIYSATIHTDPLYIPAPSEVVGSAPSEGKPLSGPQGVLPYDYAKEQLNQMVSTLLGWQLYGPTWDQTVASGKAPAIMTGALVFGGSKGNPSWTKQQWKDNLYVAAVSHQNMSNATYLTILAYAYLESWSNWHQNAELLDRVLRALDFYCVAQGSNGGFHDGDRHKKWIGGPNRTVAYSQLEDGDQYLGQALVLLYDQIKDQLDHTIDNDDNPSTPPITLRAAYTQMFLANRTYVTTNRGHAPNQDLMQVSAMYWDNEALKLLSPTDTWPMQKIFSYLYAGAGLLPDIYGGTWFSQKGMPLEGSYSCDYGVLCVDLLCGLAVATNDSQLVQQAHKAVEAMSYFYFIWNDEHGHVNLVNDAVVAWRNNYGSPRVDYGGGSFGPASVDLNIPAAIRQVQLYLAHGQVYAIDGRNHSDVHFLGVVMSILQLVSNYPKIAALPPATPLPMEPGGSDFAWADEQAGAVVIRQNHGLERLYIVLNWRHFQGNPRSPKNATANNIARIHYTTPMIDRVATIAMKSTPGYAGLYEVTYGKYMIAMNASLDQTHSVTVPKGQKQNTVDLITNRPYLSGQQLTLKPQTTVVWWLGDEASLSGTTVQAHRHLPS
jgi:hypothetical protein